MKKMKFNVLTLAVLIGLIGAIGTTHAFAKKKKKDDTARTYIIVDTYTSGGVEYADVAEWVDGYRCDALYPNEICSFDFDSFTPISVIDLSNSGIYNLTVGRVVQ